MMNLKINKSWTNLNKMKLINFLENKIELLLEGGNTTFEIGSKVFTVDKIDFSKSKEDFPNFRKHLFTFLTMVDLEVKKECGVNLWGDGNKYFSGSSNVIFNNLEVHFKDEKNKDKLLSDMKISNPKEIIKDESDIIYNWIRKYKPSAGDIDIQVSNDSKRFPALKKVLNNLSILKSISSEEKLLSALKQKCKSKGDICVIDNKPSIGQIITAAAVRQSNEVTTLSDFLFFQMDWEPVNADEDGTPTEFSKLSRNSTIEDIEVGIKGREHKYLLRALSNILSDVANEKLKILSPKTLNELKRDESGMFSFSVNYGLRKKFWNPNDENDLNSIIEYYKENVKTKNPLSDKEIKEKIVKSEIRVEIPIEKKEYINDVNSIAKSLGLKKIDSFVNLVSQIQELTKTNKSLGSNILTKFQKKLTEQLTIAPHTFKNGTISEKIDKAFEEDYSVKIGAYKLLHKSIVGNLNISSFDKHYNSWKEKMKTNLMQSNGKFEEKEVE